MFQDYGGFIKRRAATGPERWIHMVKSALIVVDMLNDFIDEKGALYCGETAKDIVPFVRRRLEAHRQAGSLVIFLQDAHAEDDLEFEKFPKHCVAGTRGSRIIDELTPYDGEHVLPKTRYSGFLRHRPGKNPGRIRPRRGGSGGRVYFHLCDGYRRRAGQPGLPYYGACRRSGRF